MYIELAEDIRQTPKYADLYKLRKEKIERVFADAKEKHAMRYTPYTGLAQVTNWVRLKFATMNLKKLAKWKWKRNNTPSKLFDFIIFLTKTQKNPIRLMQIRVLRQSKAGKNAAFISYISFYNFIFFT